LSSCAQSKCGMARFFIILPASVAYLNFSESSKK
jgi:hypothetical protein